MNWDAIWGLAPMDGQAAAVVGQAGCVDEMSLQDRDEEISDKKRD